MNGSRGYSQEALKRLETGTYKGRKQQYRTSQDQVKAAPKTIQNKVPALEGMTRSPSFDQTGHVDTANARARYEQRIGHNPIGRTNSQSNSDKNYVVKRDRYSQLMRDNRLANDIKTLAEVNYNNANRDATVSQEWADEYGARKITGGMNKSQFIKSLTRKYGLTPEELNDMALTFHSDANKQEVANYNKQLENIGEKHSVLGSLGSFVGTLGSGVEGAYNTVVGGLTGDDRYLSNMFSTTKKGLREGAKKNIKSDVGKGAYDIGMGIGDMAVGAAAGSAPVVLAGNTANEAQASAIERGSGVRQASIYGAGAGALDYITNKIGLDKAKKLAVDSIKSAGVKKFLAQNAVAGLGEAGENVIQDLGQTVIDNIVNGKNSELRASYEDKIANGMNGSDAIKEVAKEYIAQIGTSAALGFGMGSAMQAGTTVLPKIPGLVANKRANNNLNAVSPELRAYLADALGVPEESIDALKITGKTEAELQAESENILNQLQKLSNGEMASNEYVKMGETPRYMQEYGDVDNPLVMPQNVVNKHEIDNSVITNLPEQFNNPVAVMRSRTQPNSGVVMTDRVDAHGNPVIVPIHMGKETDMGTVNEIPSVYGKKGAKNFINNSEVAFENKERVNEALSGNGVQFSELNDPNNPIFNSKIEQNGENVNGADIPPTNNDGGDVPPNNGGDKVRSFSRRGSLDETLPDEVRNTLSEDYYNIVRNADTAAKADSMFDPDNLTQTRSNLDRAVEDHDPAAALLSYKLAKAYVDSGDYDAATDVLQGVSKELTRMGQFTQAAKLAMLQNDPMAAMRAYMRDLDKLNTWGKKKYKDKWNKLELSKEDIDLINQVPKGDSEGLNNVMDQLNAKFSKQVPASWWDKAVTASKTAMLLNFRTQSRNILANVATLPIRSASDRVSALGQNVAHLINPDVKVTQSLTGGTKEQKKIATQIWDRLKDEITGENKMKDSVSSDILSQRQIFNDDFVAKWIDNLTDGGIQKLNERLGANGNQSTMETLTNFTYWLMGDFGDTPFVKKNFVNRLASYMKAQGIDNIDDVPDDAISIATQEALKATFKDDNNFTKALQGIKQKSGKFGEIALPFVKTPANLTMRAIDYSPAGLINTFRKIKSGAEANAVIDELSKNLTGTAMIYLGYKLAEKGLLSGAYSQDSDEAAWQKQQGVLENAIHVPNWMPLLGDKYVTYDWTQPAATPLVLGQTIYEAVKASDDQNADVLDVINATYKGGLKAANTIINSSPLQSLADLLGDNPYGEEGIAENITNEILEFPQRFIPSILGATARTIDPTMRDTYIKDSTLTGTIGNQVRQAEAKIPFLSKTLPASYDTWGNERTRSDSKGQAFFAQMVNPGQFGNKNETPLDAEIQRIFDATGNNAVFPLYAPRSLDLGSDGNITLTNKEHSEYQKNMGKRSYSYAESIMKNPEYKSLSDDEKAGILEKAYKLSNALVKEEMFDHVTDSDKKLKEVARNGKASDVAQYLIDGVKAKQQGTTIDKYRNGNSEEAPKEATPKASTKGITTSYKVVGKVGASNQSAPVSDEAKASAKDLGLQTKTYNKIADKAGSNADKVYKAVPELKRNGLGSSSAYYQYADALKVDSNLSVAEFAKTFNAIDSDNSKGIKQDELIDYFNKNKTSQQQADKMWKMYGDSTWKKVPSLVNGTFVKK